MIRFLFCFVGLILIGANLFAQPKKIDSINDYAISIYKQSPQEAVKILNQALRLAQDGMYIPEIAKTKNNLGIVQRDLGALELAMSLSKEAFEASPDSLVRASAQNNLGVINRKLGNYEDALENYIYADRIYEKMGLEKEQATVNNNIGMVYSMLQMNEKAVEYHEKALIFFKKIADKKGISEAKNNIAIIHASEGRFEEALLYFKQSFAIEKSLDDKKGMAESVNNIGGAYYYLGRIDSAVHYFKKSAMIEKSIGNFSGVSASYNNIVQVLLDKNELNEIEVYLDSAHQFARQSQTAEDIEMSLLNYSDYYAAKKEIGPSFEYYKKYVAFKDSVLSKSNMETLQEMEVKYDTEKKQNEILQQRAQLVEKEMEVRRKNTFIFGSLGLALVLGLLGYLLYNQQKLKNHQLQKESELKTALAKIETQNKLQEQRLRISRDLHDNIGAQLTFIISSIDNLKFGFTDIGEKLGNKLSAISVFTSQTIYELRDTIWAMNKERITFEDLQARIANFIEQAKNASENTEFSFNIEESVDETHVFSSVEGMNIYRIIQEAVNNSLKFALADEIEVNISKEGEQYQIEIADNGKGFNLETIDMGNGLNNMKKRAREIDGTLEVQTSKNGTSILLRLAKPFTEG